MKKLLIILCIAMIATIFTGCNKEKPDDIDEDRYIYDNLTRETAADSIPDGYSLDNQTIGMFYAFHVEKSVIGDNETTDIVYSKIYERNLSVEERLKVDIDFISSNTTEWGDVVEVLKKDIQSMTDAYEAVFTTNNTVTQPGLFNYYHNLNDSEYIDINERWWYTDAIMETSVDDYNYRFLYGDISINDLGCSGAIFYNKELYGQYISSNKNPEELYQTVIDGNWTLEEFTRVTKKSHIEKGGDGSNDLYGFSIFRNGEPIHYFRQGAFINYYERNAQGMIELTPVDDRLISFVEQLNECFNENPGAKIHFGINSSDVGAELDFPNGKAIFYLGTINDTLSDNFREMKQDFGILPYPKFDTEQELYMSFMHNSSVMTCCPVSADIDRVNEEVSAVIEALASESYRSVSVPYYETALKTAYTRADLDAQMIDIITGQHDTVKSTLTKNFAYEYLHYSIGVMLNDLIKSNSTNIASSYDSVKPTADAALKKLLDDYKTGVI